MLRIAVRHNGVNIILPFTKQVAAPVGICFYTLYGVNNTLKEQDKTFKELAKVLDIFTKEIERRDSDHARKIESVRYQLTKNFTKISETTGTIQNSSKIYAVEISDKQEANSGFLLNPLSKISYVGKQLYARCADIAAVELRVVPFVVDMGVGNSSDTGGDSSSGFDHFDQSDLDDILKD